MINADQMTKYQRSTKIKALNLRIKELYGNYVAKSSKDLREKISTNFNKDLCGKIVDKFQYGFVSNLDKC